MYLLILGIIYLAFIGLGAGDALFGSAWPTIQMQMDVPISYAGIVSMLIASGTITSSLLSDRMIKRFGVGKVVFCGVLSSAMVLLGFSFVSSFWMLCLLAYPLGLAGGALDAASNNHVALHYSSRAMSWLHCFWGLGAAISPIIMGQLLTGGAEWNSGYRVISFLQIGVAVLVLLSLPLWRRQSKEVSEEISKAPALGLSQILRVRGVKYIMVAMFALCSVEMTAALWASTYLVQQRGVEPEIAASYAALFFIGITAGRFVSGLVADRVGDKNMIRVGLGIIFLGIVAIWMPINSNVLALNGLIIVGLGCAPIFPSVIHATPTNFGKIKSQSIVGVQMASAYTGTTLMPPLFGLIAEHISIGLFPVFLLVMTILMLLMAERLNRLVAKEPL